MKASEITLIVVGAIVLIIAVSIIYCCVSNKTLRKHKVA